MTNQKTENMVSCACGDMYPADSYEAGFIDGKGHCENCEAAAQVSTPVAAQEPVAWSWYEPADDLNGFEGSWHFGSERPKLSACCTYIRPLYTAPQPPTSAQPDPSAAKHSSLALDDKLITKIDASFYARQELGNYSQAMIDGRTDICIKIEKRHGLYGNPPAIVTVGLQAVVDGKDINEVIEAYLNKEDE